nr:segregation protein B [Terriglobales bacterium]
NARSAAVRSDAPGSDNFYRVAIVGAGSLKGKEVAEVLSDRNFPSIDVKLLDDEESLGQLEAVGDEVTFIQKVDAEQFQNIDFTFFTSSREATKRSWKIARDAGSAIIDLSYALEDEPDAQVRSPWVERQLGQGLTMELQPGPAVAAHPAAVVLALLILRAHKVAPVRQAVATIFEPVSEHGQKGMDELHEQTVNLLSFQQLPKGVFDAQVAFNMLSRYGEHAVSTLATVEGRIVKHYRRIAPEATLPSLLLVQAPIFHGHAFAVHLSFGQNADLEALSKGMAGDHVKVVQMADDAPTNVAVAGQPDIQVSVLADGNDPNSCWLWAAADNFRISAVTGVECAETMAASRPRGKIQ